MSDPAMTPLGRGDRARGRRGGLGLGTAAVLLLASTVDAGDWPHWRGPTRNGHVDESSGWEGKSWVGEPAWRVNVGEGSSSPIVVGDAIYALGWRDGKDTLVRLEAATGRVVWARSHPAPPYGRKATGDEGLYRGVSSTPEFDTETSLLYTLSLDGELRCRDTAKEGADVWGKNLYDAYDVPRRPQVARSGQRDYGYTSSPLVYADWLLVEVGATNGNLIAFDKRTGAEVWRSENAYPPGHSGGPSPLVVEGVPCLAVHTFEGVLVVRLDEANAGRTVGTFPWRTEFANGIPSLAVHGASVLVTSEYNQKRIARLDVSLESGLREVWRVPPGSNVCSPVVSDGRVYTVQGRLHCLDFETGATIWTGGRYADPVSIVVTSDDRLITWSNNGDLTLIEGPRNSPDAYAQLAQQRGVLNRDAWPHVVLANGRLLGRDRDGNLVCWRL